MDAIKVEQFLGMLHWENKEIELLRCKGLYYATDEDGVLGVYSLQGVDDTFEWKFIKSIKEGKLFSSMYILFNQRIFIFMKFCWFTNNLDNKTQILFLHLPSINIILI